MQTIDRGASDVAPEPTRGGDAPLTDGAEGRARPEVDGAGTLALRTALAVTSLGAAGIHFAFIGDHSELSGWHAAFFAGAAWAQALWALLILARPTRTVVGAGVVANLVVAATWLMAHTTGLPVEPGSWTAEPVGWFDGIATALEALVVLGGVLLLVGRAPRLGGAVGYGLVGALGATVVLVTSLALVPGIAGEGHSHGAAGHGAAGHGAAAHDDGAMAAHHDDGTGGAQHDHAMAAGGPAAATGEHAHETPPIQPLTDAEREGLAAQLVAVREVAARYPTGADAIAAGYLPAGPMAAGAGGHFVRIDLADETDIDIETPFSLLYDDVTPDARIIGVMYYTAGGAAPDGFIGPNDLWHQHSGACYRLDDDAIFVPFEVDTDVTPEQCEAIEGAHFVERTGWMLHVWVVPGWESDHGVFSHDNPAVVCPDGTRDSGNVGTGCVPV